MQIGARVITGPMTVHIAQAGYLHQIAGRQPVQHESHAARTRQKATAAELALRRQPLDLFQPLAQVDPVGRLHRILAVTMRRIGLAQNLAHRGIEGVRPGDLHQKMRQQDIAIGRVFALPLGRRAQRIIDEMPQRISRHRTAPLGEGNPVRLGRVVTHPGAVIDQLAQGHGVIMRGQVRIDRAHRRVQIQIPRLFQAQIGQRHHQLGDGIDIIVLRHTITGQAVHAALGLPGDLAIHHDRGVECGVLRRHRVEQGLRPFVRREHGLRAGRRGQKQARQQRGAQLTS